MKTKKQHEDLQTYTDEEVIWLRADAKFPKTCHCLSEPFLIWALVLVRAHMKGRLCAPKNLSRRSSKPSKTTTTKLESVPGL